MGEFIGGVIRVSRGKTFFQAELEFHVKQPTSHRNHLLTQPTLKRPRNANWTQLSKNAIILL